MLICKQRICRSLRRRFFDLKPQTLRFLNDGVLDGSEFFLLGERIVLTGPVLVVALQRIAQTIPDGLVRRHLRQLFEFVHNRIHFVFQRLFEIAILLFTVDHAQFQCKFQQFLLNRLRWIFNSF